MRLTFEHDCLPQWDEQVGCPVANAEVEIETVTNVVIPHGGYPTVFEVPDVRCIYTNKKMKLTAIDYNRNI